MDSYSIGARQNLVAFRETPRFGPALLKIDRISGVELQNLTFVCRQPISNLKIIWAHSFGVYQGTAFRSGSASDFRPKRAATFRKRHGTRPRD